MSRPSARPFPEAAADDAEQAAAPRGLEVSGTRIPTLNDDLVLVRLSAAANAPAPLDPDERADALVRKAAKALSKPGIRRESVFRGSPHIAAYSVYPADPSKVVRESADGSKVIGRVVGGRFRPLPTKP